MFHTESSSQLRDGPPLTAILRLYRVARPRPATAMVRRSEAAPNVLTLGSFLFLCAMGVWFVQSSRGGAADLRPGAARRRWRCLRLPDARQPGAVPTERHRLIGEPCTRTGLPAQYGTFGFGFGSGAAGAGADCGGDGGEPVCRRVVWMSGIQVRVRTACHVLACTMLG